MCALPLGCLHRPPSRGSLFLGEFQVDDRLFARVEGAQRLSGTARALIVCLQLVVDIGIEAVKIVVTVVFGDEGTNLECLGIGELHDGAVDRAVVSIRHRALHGPDVLVLTLLASRESADRAQQHHCYKRRPPMTQPAIHFRAPSVKDETSASSVSREWPSTRLFPVTFFVFL